MGPCLEIHPDLALPFTSGGFPEMGEFFAMVEAAEAMDTSVVALVRMVDACAALLSHGILDLGDKRWPTESCRLLAVAHVLEAQAIVRRRLETKDFIL